MSECVVVIIVFSALYLLVEEAKLVKLRAYLSALFRVEIYVLIEVLETFAYHAPVVQLRVLLVEIAYSDRAFVEIA